MDSLLQDRGRSFDTNLLPWRMTSIHGLESAHEDMVNGYALATGVRDELDWDYERRQPLEVLLGTAGCNRLRKRSRSMARASWEESRRRSDRLLLAYAWLGFIVTPFDDVSATVNLIGNVVFALGAVVLLVAAYWNVR